jgi:hypothetical protein
VTSSRIKLDVGGRIFSVTSDMMIRYPDSFFARLFSGRWEDKKTEDGAYFINRSFQLFHHIVDFLRDGGLDVSLSEDDHRALCREADFYQLKELLDVLNAPVDHNWTLTETPNGVLALHPTHHHHCDNQQDQTGCGGSILLRNVGHDDKVS